MAQIYKKENRMDPYKEEEVELECLDCNDGYYRFMDADYQTHCDCCSSELTIEELYQELADRRFS